VNLAFHSDAMQLDERVLSGIDFLVNWRKIPRDGIVSVAVWRMRKQESEDLVRGEL